MYKIYDRISKKWQEMNHARALSNLKNNPDRYQTKAMKDAIDEIDRLNSMTWEEILNESKL